MAQLDLNVLVKVKGDKDLDNLGRKIGRIGQGLTLGITLPVVAAGTAFVNMAVDAEESEAKLRSVFDSMEAAAWTSVEALDAHAQALMDATTFDDDAVKEAQAVLLTFGEITGESFTDATEAAADLAAFWETDMSDAAAQLGKALQDPEAGMQRLSRQGIIFSDEQKEAVRALIELGDTAGAQALILDEVARQVGGVAEDLAETSGGKMTQAMNELGEAGEAMGVLLLPILSQVAGFVKGAADAFQSLSPEVQGAIAVILGIAAIVGPIALVASAVIGAFATIGGAFTALSVLLLANPFVALAAAVIAIAALIALNWDKVVESFRNLWRNITDSLRNLGEAIRTIWDGIIRFFKGIPDKIAGIGKTMWEPVGKGFGAAIDFIKGIWNKFARWWNSIKLSVPSVDVPFVGKVGGFTIGLPKLPTLATGGIVTDPTMALIGEKGPEAVIPLEQWDRGAGEIHYHVELTVIGDVKAETPEELVTVLQRVQPIVTGQLAPGW